VPLRLMLYPALLVKFWLVLDGFPLYERLLVVACQFLLCCFNFGAALPAARCRQGLAAAAAAPELQRAACRAGVRVLSARLCLRPCATCLQLCPLSAGGSLGTVARPVSASACSKRIRNIAHCSVVPRAVRWCLLFGWRRGAGSARQAAEGCEAFKAHGGARRHGVRVDGPAAHGAARAPGGGGRGRG